CDALTVGFGRIYGTLVAIVRPVDQQCAQPNRGHVILQVKMSGAVYRLLVNVESTVGGVDPRVLIASVSKPLPSPAWSEGWHSGVKLDYVTDFALHAGDFTAMEKADLVTRVVAEMHIGAPISVYGTSGAGRPESAHLIHRNGNDDDGAVVVGPDTATPRILLFHFAEQSF
ncbi:MAG: hypothetical protein KDB18_05800, partial [Salinibacterium sp.]|nr:hypothetical protein [Salinibacterium sp.]